MNSQDFLRRVPGELQERRQWIVWRTEPREDGEPTKVPFQCTGYGAATTNPQHWSRFDYAIATWLEQRVPCDGIGYVFAPDDPYCGIDLDDIWLSDADEGAEWGIRILERFSDTYNELSPSGQGAKIWCRARASRCGKWPIRAGAIEIYDRARFFTMTGQSAGVITIADHQDDVAALVANLDDTDTEERRRRTPMPIPEAIPQGQRHNTLVSLAGTMWRRGMTREAIEAALIVTDEKQCDPPRGAEHVRKIVASMHRWTR
jgi:primase-polymerase (primpol)-like protein